MNQARPAHPFAEATLQTDHGVLSALARPGEGVPVVMVHGVMADARAWVPVIAGVAAGRPALVLNRRGRHPSGPVPPQYDVESETADLLRWLDTLDGPVDLIGHSYGGLIGVEAVRRGAAIRSLALYEPVAGPFGADMLPLLESAVEAGDLDTAVKLINVDLSGYRREHVEELRTGPAWQKLMDLARPAAAELGAINRFTFTEPEEWRIPTTLIAGELSRHRPPYGPSVDVFRKALGIDDVTVLEGQDHLAHVTAPIQLAEVLSKSLHQSPQVPTGGHEDG